MENNYFLRPVDVFFDPTAHQPGNLIGNHITAFTTRDNFPDLGECDIALIGVLEDRGSLNNLGCAAGSNRIREYFYKLHTGAFKPRIADLGNIHAGHSISDTYFALGEVMVELLQKNIIPIVLGGSQELTFTIYNTYARAKKVINIVAVDRQFDLGPSENDFHSESYLKKIIQQQPNYLFNYTNIGYQTYFVDQEAIKLMDVMFFDIYRLGAIRATLNEAEPLIRNGDMLTFDVSAIRANDAPGHTGATPNGFTSEEACQLARYAGMADKLTTFGLFEYNPSYDSRGLTAQLIAQMLWYFVEGFYLRQYEDPIAQPDDFIKYIVPVEAFEDGLIFFRSKRSDRWWMNVGSNRSIKPEFRRHTIIPCSVKDYNIACENEIPDRWLKAYQKLM
ncbi:MAG: formimidoylglutamase [Bacteroidales bacterium]|nr:formimidoylglutamase [Bacteroidales bacterium]MDZ4204380.1 formimidoylglutamase [Bacteroidales bacterium]